MRYHLFLNSFGRWQKCILVTGRPKTCSQPCKLFSEGAYNSKNILLKTCCMKIQVH